LSAEKLIIFCKAPRPGTVKTRLAASVGVERATQIYLQIASAVFDSAAGLDDVQLCYAPSDARAEVASWKRRPSWRLEPQCEGDLGARMSHAFDQAFKAGAQRVLLVGTDTPEIRASDFLEAFMALRQSDVVLGPAEDGGYWMIGLSEPHHELFEGVEWSTSSVLSSTLQAASARRLTTHCLRWLADVDTEADWNAFVQRRAGT